MTFRPLEKELASVLEQSLLTDTHIQDTRSDIYGPFALEPKKLNVPGFLVLFVLFSGLFNCNCHLLGQWSEKANCYSYSGCYLHWWRTAGQ